MFNAILKSQTHHGDLLLIDINGFYDPEINTWTNVPQISPYVIGLSKEGHSEKLHYEFIHNYRTNAISEISHPDYLKELEWAPEKKEQIEIAQKSEGITIQLEMLLYLKIWEADAFIKRFYQLTRLVNGEEYDWHFKIQESSRDNNSTGSRQDIIRKLVRERLKNKYPAIYNSIKKCYKTQIRNSIAHSNYSFQSRYIHLNNFIQDDPYSQLKSISFDDWIDLFHETLVLHNHYIGFFNRVKEHYAKLAEEQNLLIEIRVNKHYPSKTTELKDLKYRPEFKDWHWNN